ncbi:VWA domain-containing protein [Solihabitans fulvus]|uniref:VWA domain-containing protein n=1 Tax=Solihabitans fulvus TaxID=1892852 RepID=A0A5B2WUB8_9PSEU|nr:substrate-binding and VWA domain-containing protein [Solihabitans fulvus]KAA2254076.1 VWA domain-containing protein [Solihabitans fulvus]
MARHRALRTTVRRGVARWPLAIVGLVVLVLIGWLGWTWLGGVLDRRAAAQAGGCGQGDSVLRVAVAPSAADAVRAVAQTWTASHPVVLEHCIRVDVQSIDSKVVLDGLTQGWDDNKLGPRPQAWLPDSSLWANRLSAQNHGLVGSPPQSVATSPVLLAMPQSAAQVLQSSSGFRWSDLPDLLSAPDGWTRFGRPDWGAFKIAMPDPAISPPTAMAIQSALAGASQQGIGPVTVDMLGTGSVKDLLTKLVASRPSGLPDTTTEALDKLTRVADGNGDVNAAGFSAVPTFEVDLYRRNTGKDNGAPPLKPLYGVPAGGPNPVADFPFMALAGNWVNEEQGRGAQKFGEFLRTPDQQKVLAAAGLRVGSTEDHPKATPGLRWSATTQNLVAADANTTQQISASWASAEDGGQVVTVLADVSHSMTEDGGDGRTRIDWLRAALTGQVNRAVSGSIGLWEFSRDVDGGKAYRELVPTAPVSQQRDALTAGIGQLQPMTAPKPLLYTSIAAAYEAATQNYQDGRHNRVVVLTDSANDGGLTAKELTTQLTALVRTDKPVPISVIGIGPDIDRQALSDLARLTGGSLSTVDDGRGIEPALGQLLSISG